MVRHIIVLVACSIGMMSCSDDYTTVVQEDGVASAELVAAAESLAADLFGEPAKIRNGSRLEFIQLWEQWDPDPIVYLRMELDSFESTSPQLSTCRNAFLPHYGSIEESLPRSWRPTAIARLYTCAREDTENDIVHKGAIYNIDGRFVIFIKINHMSKEICWRSGCDLTAAPEWRWNAPDPVDYSVSFGIYVAVSNLLYE